MSEGGLLVKDTEARGWRLTARQFLVRTYQAKILVQTKLRVETRVFVIITAVSQRQLTTRPAGDLMNFLSRNF
jgi:hypothetical protein